MVTKNKKDTTSKSNPQQDPEKQIIKEHVRAFRSHLLWLTGSFAVAAIIGFEFKEIVQGLLTLQLADLSLMNLKPAEDMHSTITVALFTGALVALPLVVYHAYRFLEPILERGSSYAMRLFFSSWALTIIAMAYAFMVTIPLALHGMAAYGQDATELHITTQSFLNVVITNSLVTVALFQIPLAVTFINSVHPFSGKTRMRLQAIVLPLAIIAAFVSTPFTSFNRGITGVALIALPAVILFEAGMLWAKMHAKGRKEIQSVVENSKEAEEMPYFEAEQEEERPVAFAPAPAPIVAPVTATVDAEPELDSISNILDAMLEDSTPVAPRSSYQMVPPPSLDIAMDEVEERVSTPVVTPAVVKVVPTPVISRPRVASVSSTIAPARRSVTSFDISSRAPARPVMQPQPVVRRAVAAMPMTKTIDVQKTTAPVPRNTPQPTIPFGMASIRRQQHAVEGLLAVPR